MAAKQKTLFKLPHWCPSCRVYIESFEGEAVGGLKEISVGVEVALEQNVTLERRCGSCSHVYSLMVELAESRPETQLVKQPDGTQTIAQTAVPYKNGERRPVLGIKGGTL